MIAISFVKVKLFYGSLYADFIDRNRKEKFNKGEAVPLFPPQNVDAVMISREDSEHPLSSFSHFPFRLDGLEWPTVEHYFQAMKFVKEADRERVRLAATPNDARKQGKAKLFKKIRKDWNNVDEIVMTRAVYTQAKTHNDIADALIETGDKKIMENSQYDYTWGCGRDGRGLNKYGVVLMNVRNKLLQEIADSHRQQ